jgi:FKBP-type peptidyl-prolyl cis-trans isomerase
MPKKIVYIIGIVIILIGVLFATLFKIYWHKKVDTASSADTSVNSTSAPTQSPASLQVTSASGLQGNKMSSTSTNQLAVAGPAQATSVSENKIDPTTFSQYEKYASSPNSAFGDVVVGVGAEVKAGTKVAMTYSGWLTNGKLFDKSKTDSNGNPVPFLFTESNHEVILGMEEGVFGMKVGGKRIIIIPPALGYGSNDQGNIPANSTLVFEVTLLAAQ